MSATATATVERPAKPFVLPVNFDGIPAAMKAVKRWIFWRYTFVSEKNKKGRWSKTPFCSTTENAKSDDPKTWKAFDPAQRLYEIYRHRPCAYDGVGFVLGDGWWGIDLDDCLLPDGTLEPWAAEIVERFVTYTEVSPSGTGLKIFLRSSVEPPFVEAPPGRKPATGCKRSKIDGVSLGGGDRAIELYWERKYFCVTGHRWPDLATFATTEAQA